MPYQQSHPLPSSVTIPIDSLQCCSHLPEPPIVFAGVKPFRWENPHPYGRPPPQFLEVYLQGIVRNLPPSDEDGLVCTLVRSWLDIQWKKFPAPFGVDLLHGVLLKKDTSNGTDQGRLVSSGVSFHTPQRNAPLLQSILGEHPGSPTEPIRKRVTCFRECLDDGVLSRGIVADLNLSFVGRPRLHAS